MNLSLELFLFYFKSPSDLKTASHNRPNTYGSPCSLKKLGSMVLSVGLQAV
jgi:hypothetical protein